MRLEDLSKGPWGVKQLATVPLTVDGNGNVLSQFYLGSTDATRDQATRDANFTALAQQAFEIMMRRKWGLMPTWRDKDNPEWIVMFTGALPPGNVYEKFYSDPYTAIIEADKLFPENAPTNG